MTQDELALIIQLNKVVNAKKHESSRRSFKSKIPYGNRLLKPYFQAKNKHNRKINSSKRKPQSIKKLNNNLMLSRKNSNETRDHEVTKEGDSAKTINHTGINEDMLIKTFPEIMNANLISLDIRKKSIRPHYSLEKQRRHHNVK